MKFTGESMAGESNDEIVGKAIGRGVMAAMLPTVALASALIKKDLLTKEEVEEAFSIINEDRMDDIQRQQYSAAKAVLLSYL